MSRFHYTSESPSPRIPLRLISALLPFLIAALFVVSIRSFGTYTADKQLESLQNALHRNIIQCYAIEGIYPPSLSYLQEHYGLTYDEARFFIDYHQVAGNLYPDVTVLERGR